MKWLLSIMFVLIIHAVSAVNTDPLLQTSELPQYIQEASQMPTYTYPYPDLPEKLAQLGKTSLPLFGYGSLIDENSARKTLSAEALATRRPAIAFGVIRTFDRDIPFKPESPFGVPCDPNSRGMLNVQKSGMNEFINGVVMDIPLKDISALLEREIGYDLIPVVIADWDNFTQGKLKFDVAYILRAPRNSSYVNQNILPRPGYYEMTRDATKGFGDLFGQIWINSTYLGDGKTSMVAWEKEIQNGNKSTLVCVKSQ